MMHGQKNFKLLIAVKQFSVHSVLGQIYECSFQWYKLKIH